MCSVYRSTEKSALQSELGGADHASLTSLNLRKYLVRSLTAEVPTTDHSNEKKDHYFSDPHKKGGTFPIEFFFIQEFNHMFLMNDSEIFKDFNLDIMWWIRVRCVREVRG
jgi:hypothetical protein